MKLKCNIGDEFTYISRQGKPTIVKITGVKYQLDKRVANSTSMDEETIEDLIEEGTLMLGQQAYENARIKALEDELGIKLVRKED